MTHPSRKPDEHYAHIVDLQRSGAMSLQEIADAYGVSKAGVARWMREARRRGLAPDNGRSPLWSNPCPHCGAPASVRKDIAGHRAPGSRKRANA